MQLLNVLLAQNEPGTSNPFVIAVIVLGSVLIPFVVGTLIARRLRMQDHGWKIGTILCSLLVATLIVAQTWNATEGKFEFRKGIDLQGGVILIYEIKLDDLPTDEEDPQNPGGDVNVNMDALIEALQLRINPTGTKEIVVRPYGANQVEIIIPEVNQQEVDRIKKTIQTSGVLEFRIVANSQSHADVLDLARDMADTPQNRRSRRVRDPADGETLAVWARLARVSEDQAVDDIRPFKLAPFQALIRNAQTGELIVGAENRDDPLLFARWAEARGIKEVDILMATTDGQDVTGADLGAVSKGFDERLNPCILFNLSGTGIDRFARLTKEYEQQQLGIMLDEELLSAPTIQEMIQGRGRITGNFTEDEVEFMVNILQAGSLPVVLNPLPISENVIDPLLGQATIEQGWTAIVLSLGLVLVFILIYYRFAGLVACLALLSNLLFILALMVLIDAAFTLPGLAGLVLTVGMSVDANVLIFERIREELNRGAALRMAIRNGFARATTTIVDANVTTLITAIVLYAIGTDQIRGFAVTLFLGICMSMYTAIFCSRVVFDVAERLHWVTKLNMSQILGATNIDFLASRKLAAVVSVTVIAIGMGGVAARGTDIFDIDFRGGTSVHVQFEEPVPTDFVRETLGKSLDESIRRTVTALNSSAGEEVNETFKVDTSIAEVAELQQVIQEAFKDSKVKLATYSLDFTTEVVTEEVETSSSTLEAAPATGGGLGLGTGSAPAAAEDDGAAAPPAGEPQESGSTEPEGGEAAADGGDQPESEGSSEESSGSTDSSGDAPEASSSGDDAAPESSEATPKEGDQGGLHSSNSSDQLAFSTEVAQLLTQTALGVQEDQGAAGEPADSGEGPASTEESTEEAPAANTTTVTSILATLEFDETHPINADTLTSQIEAAAEALDIPLSYFELSNAEWDGVSSNSFSSWQIKFSATEEQTTQLLNHLKVEFQSTPVWPSASKIGSQVAGRMKEKAAFAMLASLFGIVVYIWIRFQRVVYGLAAVVALVHDVLVTLGAIAVSFWLTDALGFLLIEEFKISLPIVAALLTIIGYSLNDTIVVFDRIREVKGKSPVLTKDMINTSINQTLGRTLLTSLTTLLVVVILYAIGGEGIHGFAFSLVIGVIVGTYSSIFVASPTLLWMSGEQQKSPKAKSVPAQQTQLSS